MLFRLICSCAIILSFSSATVRGQGASQQFPLRKLILADSAAKAGAIAVGTGGETPVVVDGIPFLAGPDLAPRIAPFLGRIISDELANALAVVIAQFAREHDVLAIEVTIAPIQDIANGVLRLVVGVGRYKDMKFSGNRWFSSKLLEQRLGIKPGDEVRLSTLESAVNWANTNPFRQIKVLVNNLPTEPGKADLIIGVQERLPFRFAVSVDDSGNDVIGNRRYTGSVQFGNLWGLDHQGSYQFATTDHPKVYQAHAIDYRVPLPWRHFLQFNFSYAKSHPVFPGGFVQDGENIGASLRYMMSLRRGDRPVEAYIGVDFKEGNNNFLFSGTSVSDAKVDSFQAVAGVTTVRRDAHGSWLFGAGLNLSPGNLNSRNTDANFQPDLNPATFRIGRIGAKARYVTGTVSVQRSQILDRGWEFLSRTVLQVTSTNLTDNEKFAVGGSASVRGFNENIFAGDQGFVFSNDVQSPVLRKSLPFFSKKTIPIETRFVFFYDAAQAFFKHPSAFDAKYSPLASTGLGLRLSMQNQFSLNFDYGWQITHLPRGTTEHGRGHLKVVLAF